MGAVQNVVDRLRRAFVLDKERGGDLLAKGSTSPTYPDSGYDLLQAYGYDALSDYLRLEHDLLSRYVDYEEMDDYPEVACLTRSSEIATVVFREEDNVAIAEVKMEMLGALAERALQYPDEPIYVLSVDLRRRRIVPAVAIGPKKTGTSQRVVKVTYEEYRSSPGKERESWSITCTPEHLFMLRDGSYKAAGDLGPGDRLMPCATKVAKSGYTQVRSPWDVNASGSPAWRMLHRLVAEELILKGPVPKSHVVHHEDEDKTNAHPQNLVVESRAHHTKIHAITKQPEIRQKIREHTQSRWDDPEERLKLVKAQKAVQERRRRGGSWRNPDKGVMPEEHRAKIRVAHEKHKIPLARDVVEAAIRSSASLNEAAKKLEVSWNTLRRRAEEYGIDAYEVLGTSRPPNVYEHSGGNHVVVSVEEAGYEDVFDLEVPGYHNFACNGVFVHNSAIDIYADDASQPDTTLGRTVWVTSQDRTLQGVLDDLLHKRLRLDEEIWEITRSLVKYGNNYEEMLVTHEGVVGLNFMPAPTVRRVEGPRGELYGFVQDFKGRFGYAPQEFQKILAQRTDAIRNMMQPGAAKQPGNQLQHVSALEPWEVAHFRLRGKHRRSIYGYSVLEPARWIWKRLMLLEDAAMIYRLQRAPERFAFYVDVGDLPPAEALAFVNKIRQQHKKKRFVNPSTGKLDLKFEPLSPDDDFYVPVRKGVEGTRIEVLGGPSWQHMEDVEYFQRKLFSALKVPKAYLAQDESAARAVLSSEDVRFARSVLRVQREVRNGLRKVTRTHLAALNIDPYAVEYDIHMTVPSAIFELAQLEVRNARADLAARMKEHVSLRWVLTNVYQLSDEDIEVVLKERTEDIRREGSAQADVEKMSLRAAAEVERENMPAGGGGGGAQAPRFAHAGAPKGMKLLEAKLATLPARIRRSISEAEMNRGDREAEKRASDKLDRLLRSNDQQVRRIQEVGSLLREVAGAAKR